MSTESIWEEIRAERERQDQQWGGAAHDDEHDGLDWLSYLLEHAAKALSGWVRNVPVASGRHWTVDVPSTHVTHLTAYRKQLVRVAALAVAAIESHDRKTSRGQ